MLLDEVDVKRFIKVQNDLLAFANEKMKIYDLDLLDPENEDDFSPVELRGILQAIYDDKSIISEFISQMKTIYTEEMLEIATGWQHMVEKNFVLLRNLKKYTIFLDADNNPPIAYGVLGRFMEIRDVTHRNFPILAKTRLIPYKTSIIYDGFLEISPDPIDYSAKMDFNKAFEEAKANFGIITALPFNPEGKMQNDKERLRTMLKTKKSRELVWDEIVLIANQSHELKTLFHQEMGKISAKDYKKQLKERNITNGWFAIYDGLILASGTSKIEAKTIISKIIPPNTLDFVYFFQNN